jgi:type I restriction enzyme S subunit
MALLGDAIQIRKNNLINVKDDTGYLIAGIQNYGKGVVIRRTVKGSELTMKKYQIIEENQLMWCKVDTKNGAFGVTKKEHIGALASTNMCLADINKEKYLPVFIETLFAINPFHEWITKYSLGSTNRKYLTPIQLIERVEIPDLSIEQQKNFLLKVSVLNESGLVIENQNQSTYLTKLRQAILQDAIEGKLTADWRKKHPVRKGDPDYDAEALLEKIKAEKEKLIKEGKIKKEKFQESILEHALEIPSDWNSPMLGEISKQITDGTHQTPTYTSIGQIFLSAQNVKPFRFMPENHKFVSEKAFHEYRRNKIPEIGDLLIGRVGAGIGETAVIDREIDFAFYVSLGMVKTFKELTLPDYLAIVSNSPYGVRYSKGNISSGGVSAGNYNLGRIRSLKIPLPPLAEQQVIVDRVEKLLSMVDELEKQVFERKKQSEQLMQAVLREAFEGES